MALRNSRKFSTKLNSKQRNAYQNALRMIPFKTPIITNAAKRTQKKNTAVARKTW